MLGTAELKPGLKRNGPAPCKNFTISTGEVVMKKKSMIFPALAAALFMMPVCSDVPDILTRFRFQKKQWRKQ